MKKSNLKMSAETFNNLPNYFELALKYGVSRGQNTYGYNTVTLTEVVGNSKKYRECGGGYDMIGSVFGQFIKHNFTEALEQVVDHGQDYYGLTSPQGKLRIDGACGFDCMEKIVKNLLGYDVSYEYKRDRKGRPQYKTAIKLTKKNIPEGVRLLTEKQVLNKPVFNVNKTYGYVSELFFRGDVTAAAVGYYIKKNPEGKYIALPGHSNMWYLQKVPAKMIKEALGSN